MWLRRLHSKLSYGYARRIYHNDKRLDAHLVAVQGLKPLLFSATDNPSPFTHTLTVLYPNVEVYDQKLRWLNYSMTTQESLPGNWCDYVGRSTSVAQFFTDSKGNTLDPVATLVALQLSAVIFLQRLDGLEKFQIGPAGHNARVLAKFRLHLLDLFHALILYTHHE